MPRPRRHFQVTVNKIDIHQYVLPHDPVVIDFDLALEEHQARIFMGLSIAEYNDMPGVPGYCDENQPVSKCHVLAMYRLTRLIGAVRDDVNAKAAKKRRLRN